MEKSIMFIKSYIDRKEYFRYSIKLKNRKRRKLDSKHIRFYIFFRIIYSYFRYPFGFYGMRYLELPITTACTLRCRDCANLIQYYKSEYNKSNAIVGSCDTIEIIKSIKNLCKCVDYIEELHVLGGEPLLNKDLVVILKCLISQKNIRHITIVTNGTILPDWPILDLLCNDKCEIFISNYGQNSIQKEALSKLCVFKGIRYKVLDNSKWYLSGGVECRQRSEEDMREQYSKCGEFCRSLLRGKLYICPRSAHGTDLGIVNDFSVNMTDIRSLCDKREELLKLEDLGYVLMCNYCNEGTNEYVPIQRGVQWS